MHHIAVNSYKCTILDRALANDEVLAFGWNFRPQILWLPQLFLHIFTLKSFIIMYLHLEYEASLSFLLFPNVHLITSLTDLMRWIQEMIKETLPWVAAMIIIWNILFSPLFLTGTPTHGAAQRVRINSSSTTEGGLKEAAVHVFSKSDTWVGWSGRYRSRKKKKGKKNCGLIFFFSPQNCHQSNCDR